MRILITDYKLFVEAQMNIKRMKNERAIMIVDNKQLCILTHGVLTISLFVDQKM